MTFTNSYLFPASLAPAARRYARATQQLARDMRLLAATSSPARQALLIQVTVINDLFLALRFEHLLLFPSIGANRFSHVESEILALGQNYATALGTFNRQQLDCRSTSCRTGLVNRLQAAIGLSVVRYQREVAVPQRALAANVAYINAVVKVGTDVQTAFGNVELPYAQQSALFTRLTSADVRKIDIAQRALIAAIASST